MLATYINLTSFSVEGEYDQLFIEGRAVRLMQGEDGPADTYVDSSSYDHETDLTTVVVDDAVVTANLVSVQRGSSSPASLAKHTHPEIPAAALNQAQINDLLTGLIPTETITAGENLAAFDVVYADSSDSGKFKKAQADGTEAERDVRLILSDAPILDDATGEAFPPSCFVTNPTWTWTPGVWLYLSNTAGEMSETPGTYEVRVAWALSATMVFFFPVPESGGAGFTLKGPWLTATSYVISPEIDVVENNGSSYACTVNHTSAAATEPGVGVNWQTVWVLFAEKGDQGSPGSLSSAGDAATGVSLIDGIVAGVLNLNVLDSAQFEETAGVMSIKEGVAGGGPAPDYTPPALAWKDVDEIYVPSGRYFRGGHRHAGQYKDLTNLALSWDVASQLSVDVDATYAAGSSPGMIGGAKVNSSWYSVFMLGNTVNDFLILPYVRAKAIAYSAPDTTINPGDHNTGAANENGFIVAADAWNNYRLILKKPESPALDGTVFTIADTTDGTPDGIVVTGDITASVVVGDWLQLIPPAATACLYLGTIRIDGSGNLLQFRKKNWRTNFQDSISVNAHTHTTDYANTECAPGLPPCAEIAHFYGYLSVEGSNSDFVAMRLAHGDTTTTPIQFLLYGGAASTALKFGADVAWFMSLAAKIRNRCSRALTSTPYTISVCQFNFMGWEE